MKDSVKNIGATLKKARLEKKLSQRELSEKVGMPQSHISKIESGLVDLQTSSLIELSRILELELMLVPRILVNTVQALQREQKGSKPRPMYRLEEVEDEE